MVDIYKKEITILGRPVYGQMTRTDDGIQVLIAGGDRSHIGAVAVVGPDGSLSMNTFPGHKETVIAEKWARELYKKYGQPIVASAGIHYDGISKEEIRIILEETDKLLKDFL